MDTIKTAGVKLQPFWGRIVVVESPVEEEERQSGILVPIAYDGDDGVRRGVIAAVDRSFEGENPTRKAAAEALVPGVVVWFRGSVGHRILGSVVLSIEDVLAYETDE